MLLEEMFSQRELRSEKKAAQLAKKAEIEHNKSRAERALRRKWAAASAASSLESASGPVAAGAASPLESARGPDSAAVGAVACLARGLEDLSR
jgi:hypothetical protein